MLVEVDDLYLYQKQKYMENLTEVNTGELVVNFTHPPVTGKVTFEELGFSDEDLKITSGFMRLVFNLSDIKAHHYFKMPTIEVAYNEKSDERHWQCDFNDETIVDKTDHHGNSTVILLNRKKLDELEHRHENTLVLHAEFPEEVQIIAKDSYINFFV